MDAFVTPGPPMSACDTAPPQSLHTLYSDHHAWLFGWLRKRLGCHDNAADLAHDTFLRVLLKPELEALRQLPAYLATIAYGLVKTVVARRYR